jgi:hypothetical protein
LQRAIPTVVNTLKWRNTIMAIMVHSQPSATSGMSSNAGANGNGFHTGEFMSVEDSWEIGEDWEDE